MKRKLLSTAAVACIILSASTSAAQLNGNDRTARGAQSRPAATAMAGPADRGDLLQDAISAVNETQAAIRYIDRNKPQEALAALERATGKLEVTLARNPSLAFAPVDISSVTHDVLGSVEAVKASRTAVKRAINDGHLQEARLLMEGLASETQINVTEVPLATYPTAIKQAAALLHQGKPPEAKAVLQTALTTLVVRREIIPLPLVRAQQAIDEAKVLAAKRARTKAEDARLRRLLQAARDQVRLGETLGYGGRKGLRELARQVDALDLKTSGQQMAKGVFDHIEQLIKDARSASQLKVK